MNRIFKGISFVSALLSVIVIGACHNRQLRMSKIQTTKIDSGTKKILGIKFESTTLDLISSIIKVYESEIKVETFFDGHDGLNGSATILSDGTPFVRFNESKLDEALIVHELHHLLLSASGTPIIRWSPHIGLDSIITQNLSVDFYQLIYDPILHSVFYPEMRKNGFDPDRVQRDRTVTDIRDFSTGTVPHFIYSPMGYFQNYMEIIDTVLLNEIDNYFIARGWINELLVGREMVKFAKASQRSAPAEQVNTLINCLNTLLSGIASFEVSGWDSEQLGSIQRKIVTIEIVPIKHNN